MAKALSCVDNAADSKTYKEFTVECGVDHWGADIGAVATTTTFEECMDACEANGECVVVSWVWGTCYMKNAKNEGQSVGHVWGAVRPARVAAATPVDADAAATPSADAAATPSADAAVTPSADAAVTPSVDAAVTPSADAAVSIATPTALHPVSLSNALPTASLTLSPVEAEPAAFTTIFV